VAAVVVAVRFWRLIAVLELSWRVGVGAAVAAADPVVPVAAGDDGAAAVGETARPGSVTRNRIRTSPRYM
jgi:hypothetical protein